MGNQRKRGQLYEKSVALLLALFLLLEMGSTVVCAKAVEEKMPYYVAIGDSIAAGYGLRGDEPEQLYADFHFLTSVVHNSADTCYPRLVANAIAKATTGASKAEDTEFANLGVPGFSVNDFYKVYRETDAKKRQTYVNPYWESTIPMIAQLIAGGEFDWSEFQWGNTIVEETKKADVITFNLGANDVMQPLWSQMTHNKNPLIKIIGYLLKMATLEIDLTEVDLSAALSSMGGGDGTSILSNIDGETVKECIEYFNTDDFSKILMDSVNEIEEKYGETLDLVRQLNPDAKIVVVGAYNPYGSSDVYQGIRYTPARIITQLYCELHFGLPIVSKSLLEGIQYAILYNTLGKMAQSALDRLNEMAQTAAEERDLPFVGTMDKVENGGRIAIHPTAKQHEQIANAITAVLLPLVTNETGTETAQPVEAGRCCWLHRIRQRLAKRLA